MPKEKNLLPWENPLPAENFPRGYHERFREFSLIIGDPDAKQKTDRWWKAVLRKIFFFLPIKVTYKHWTRQRVWLPTVEITQDAPLDLLNEQELTDDLEG